MCQFLKWISTKLKQPPTHPSACSSWCPAKLVYTFVSIEQHRELTQTNHLNTHTLKIATIINDNGINHPHRHTHAHGTKRARKYIISYMSHISQIDWMFKCDYFSCHFVSFVVLLLVLASVAAWIEHSLIRAVMNANERFLLRNVPEESSHKLTYNSTSVSYII